MIERTANDPAVIDSDDSSGRSNAVILAGFLKIDASAAVATCKCMQTRNGLAPPTSKHIPHITHTRH